MMCHSWDICTQLKSPSEIAGGFGTILEGSQSRRSVLFRIHESSYKTHQRGPPLAAYSFANKRSSLVLPVFAAVSCLGDRP